MQPVGCGADASRPAKRRVVAPGRRRPLAIVAVLCVAAATLLGVSGPAGADGGPTDPGPAPETAPAWSPDVPEVPAEGDVVARMADEGIDRGEALRRFDIEREAAIVEREALRRWPSTFAGVWIDRAPFGVSVAFTKNAAANVAQLAALTRHPEALVPQTRALSLQRLTQVQGAMAADRGRLQRGERPGNVPGSIRDTGGRFDLDIDVRANRLVTHVATGAATEQVRGDFARTYGAPVEVKAGVAEPATCYQTDCRYAMLGGIKVNQGTTSGYCSTAFASVSGSTRSVLSAGHCHTMNSANYLRYHSGSYYGAVDLYQVSGNVDVERIRKYGSSWRESSKFYVAGEDPRLVTSYTTYANTVIGTYIGKTGVRTGTSRGYVTSKTLKPSYVPNASNFIGADFCVNGGDSGGAVWRSNSAWGIVSGRFTGTACNGNPNGSDGGTGIFGSIQYALSTMSVSLLMNVNLAPTASYSHTCDVLLKCTFYGSGSNDEDGSITTYSWNFGDGTTGTGATKTKTYTVPGTYSVRLTVTDNNGATHSVTKSITVI